MKGFWVEVKRKQKEKKLTDRLAQKTLAPLQSLVGWRMRKLTHPIMLAWIISLIFPAFILRRVIALFCSENICVIYLQLEHVHKVLANASVCSTHHYVRSPVTGCPTKHDPLAFLRFCHFPDSLGKNSELFFFEKSMQFCVEKL